jgi:hypothetical protein
MVLLAHRHVPLAVHFTGAVRQLNGSYILLGVPNAKLVQPKVSAGLSNVQLSAQAMDTLANGDAALLENRTDVCTPAVAPV